MERYTGARIGLFLIMFFLMFSLFSNSARSADWNVSASVNRYIPEGQLMDSTGYSVAVDYKRTVFFELGTFGEADWRRSGQLLATLDMPYIGFGLMHDWEFDYLVLTGAVKGIVAKPGVGESPTGLHAAKLWMMNEFAAGSKRDDKGLTNFSILEIDVPDYVLGAAIQGGLDTKPWYGLSVGLHGGWMIMSLPYTIALKTKNWENEGHWKYTGKEKYNGFFGVELTYRF